MAFGSSGRWGLSPNFGMTNFYKKTSYTIFAGFSKNFSYYGSVTSFPTSIKGLTFSLLFMGVNKQQYAGFGLDFQKNFGKLEIKIHVSKLFDTGSSLKLRNVPFP